jgi:hypothetical protein
MEFPALVYVSSFKELRYHPSDIVCIDVSVIIGWCSTESVLNYGYSCCELGFDFYSIMYRLNNAKEGNNLWNFRKIYVKYRINWMNKQVA